MRQSLSSLVWITMWCRKRWQMTLNRCWLIGCKISSDTIQWGCKTSNILILKSSSPSDLKYYRYTSCWESRQHDSDVVHEDKITSISIPPYCPVLCGWVLWPISLRKLTRDLQKGPLVFNGRLANRKLTSLVKEATVVATKKTINTEFGYFLSFTPKETIAQTTDWTVKLYGWTPIRLSPYQGFVYLPLCMSCNAYRLTGHCRVRLTGYSSVQQENVE